MPPMKRLVLKYGLLAGGLMSALMLGSLSLQLDLERGMLVGYAGMIAAFLLVFAAVRAYRDAAPGGTVSFGRALAVGTLVVLVASACYTAAWEAAYFGFYRDGFLAHYEAATMRSLQADHATPAEIEAKRAELRRFAEWYDNPVLNAGATFMEPLPPGLLMALAAAGLLRRRRTPEAAAALAGAS